MTLIYWKKRYYGNSLPPKLFFRHYGVCNGGIVMGLLRVSRIHDLLGPMQSLLQILVQRVDATQYVDFENWKREKLPIKWSSRIQIHSLTKPDEYSNNYQRSVNMNVIKPMWFWWVQNYVDIVAQLQRHNNPMDYPADEEWHHKRLSILKERKQRLKFCQLEIFACVASSRLMSGVELVVLINPYVLSLSNAT